MVKIFELSKDAYMTIKAILGDRVFNEQEYRYNVWYVTLNENVILKYSSSMLILDLGGRKVMVDNREFLRVVIS